MSIFFSVYFAIGLLYMFITFMPDDEDPNDIGKYVKKKINEYGARTIGIALMFVMIVFLILWPIGLVLDIFNKIRNLFKKERRE